ncbi:MAG TPA: hypothetical protein VMZ27_04545 [Candidatus Saccharimonadales bacterium]|nr:hypothetical protein [Candidatus Saccharimonadales bacterium]
MKSRLRIWLSLSSFIFSFLVLDVRASDITVYSVSKGIYYEQTQSGPSVALTNNGYAFDARLDLSQPGTASGAQVKTPTGDFQPLAADGDTLEFKKKYNSQAKLDSNYPDGVYILTANTAHDGAKTLYLALAGVSAPSAPHVQNYAEAQTVNPNGWFLLKWDRFQGGDSGDFIQFRIEDSTGNKVFETPDIGEMGALDGTAMFAWVPPGTLKPGKTYAATLLFQKTAARDDSSYPGAHGLSYFFGRTSFPLVTTSQGAPDVESLILSKGSSYEQTNAWSINPEAGNEFIFDAKVNGASDAAVVNALLQTPGNDNLILADNGKDWEYQDAAGTAELLESKYPVGTYKFSLTLLNDGTRQVPINFIPCPYPPAPHLNSFDPQQPIPSDRDLLIAWDPWNEGTWYDLIQVRIEDSSDNKVFETDDFGEGDALDGHATSTIVPAGTLQPGQTYKARIVFTKLVAIDAGTYPGVLAMATYYTRTKFDIITRPPDVKSFSISKSHEFIQTTAGALQLNPNTGYVFTANVAMSDSNTVTAANISTPFGATFPLRYQRDGQTWAFQDGGNNQSLIDSAYPDGNYTLTISTVHDGTKTVSLPVNGYFYPNAPHISNLGNAQSINPSNSFTLHWDPFVGGTVNDYIYEKVCDSSGAIVDDSKAYGRSTALNGTDTSAKIGSGKLAPGAAYDGSVSFQKVLAVDTNSYRGAIGYSALISRTQFPVTTTGPGNPAAFTRCSLNSSGCMQLAFTSIPGKNYQILSSTNLVNWVLVANLTSYGPETTWLESSPANLGKCFYRIALGN